MLHYYIVAWPLRNCKQLVGKPETMLKRFRPSPYHCSGFLPLRFIASSGSWRRFHRSRKIEAVHIEEIDKPPVRMLEVNRREVCSRPVFDDDPDTAVPCTVQPEPLPIVHGTVCTRPS